MTRSGTIIFKGKWPDIHNQLHMVIRREEASHDRVIGKPFSLHPEVAERMEKEQ